MRCHVALLALVGAVLIGCSEQTPAVTVGGRTAPPGGSFVRFAGDVTAVVEVADSREEHLRGLMGRRDLGPDDGMLFRFSRPQATGFWMKDTLIPLAIAYMKNVREGLEIVAIREMVPCRADPCPTYAPGTRYDAALEMTAGWFRRHDIRVGAICSELVGDPVVPVER